MIPRLLLLLCVALLASCALKEKISPLKLDTQQGHVLPPKAVAKLKTGMTKAQLVEGVKAPTRKKKGK